jgi:hypothetical protein
MLPESAVTAERARTASKDELKSLVHAATEDALLALLENPEIEEAHITSLLERLDLPANVLSAIAAESKWLSSEAVRMRLASHPRTPKRVALATARQLYLFDLVRLSLLPSAPADIKRVAEEIVISRVPHIPVGQKLTLARRGPARVAGAIVAEGHAQAVKLGLNNPYLTESQILKVLNKVGVPERVVVAVAEHPKWSLQYNVSIALVRNPQTPFSIVSALLPRLKADDLRDLAAIQDVTPRLRKQIEEHLAQKAPGRENTSGESGMV